MKAHCVRDKNKSKRTKTIYFKRSLLCKIDDVTNTTTKNTKMRKQSVICSRIRERDKKNAE